MFSLICAWINAGANNREAGELRRHRTHYYAIVMDFLWTGTKEPGVETAVRCMYRDQWPVNLRFHHQKKLDLRAAGKSKTSPQPV